MKGVVREMKFQGVTDSIRGWARRLGISYSTLRKRIDKGWPLEKALSSEIADTASQRVDLSGQQFGRLVVLMYSRPNQHHQSMWLCRCKCGQEIEVVRGNLVRGMTKSCGCFRDEALGNRRRTHGMSRTITYQVWKAMLRRCNNPNDKGYPRYGGAGVRVCKRWQGQKGFLRFLEDMGSRPSRRHSIGRLQNSRGYCKSNCAWQTFKEQQRNRSDNRLLTWQGETLCVSAWAERLRIPKGTIFGRLRRGWSAERALSTPRRKYD
jgi:hypothetical protein